MFARPLVAAVQVGVLTGGGASRQPELLCECKWPDINGLSSLPAHVEIKEKSGPRSWSEPAMTSRVYNLGNIAPGNGAWRGILVKSKRSRFASVTILRGA